MLIGQRFFNILLQQNKPIEQDYIQDLDVLRPNNLEPLTYI
jgi:hypothetical protein